MISVLHDDDIARLRHGEIRFGRDDQGEGLEIRGHLFARLVAGTLHVTALVYLDQLFRGRIV